MPEARGMTLTTKKLNQLTFRERCSLHIQVQRKKRVLSQEKLSEGAGFHRTYVSNFERGVQNMSMDALEGLRKALGLASDDEAAPTLRQVFAENLRYVRIEKGISQEELGFIAGLHRTYVSQAERCVTNISLDNVERLATALEVTAESLLGFETKADVKEALVTIKK
jgi:transcriptional regulator with XRE-family HTH domain